MSTAILLDDRYLGHKPGPWHPESPERLRAIKERVDHSPLKKSLIPGFCLFNNVAIAAEYALQRHNLQKVAILDFDVHHGNGTQHSFYDRSDVFYLSLHRYPFYPGSGARREEGEGRGKGFTRNIPFPGGEGDEEYLKAFDTEVVPLLSDYAPDLLLVSAGFDAHLRDPLGGMNVTTQGYAAMTRQIVQLANKSCEGRIVMVLEGGYDLQALSESVTAVLAEMTLVSVKKLDPSRA